MPDAPPHGYYAQYSAFAKQNGYTQPDIWPLDLAAKTHATHGYAVKETLWGYARADYWAIEAELIIESYGAWDAKRATFYPDYSLASAWDQAHR